MMRPPPRSTRFPYTTLFRSANNIDVTAQAVISADRRYVRLSLAPTFNVVTGTRQPHVAPVGGGDRKSTRLNSSHANISYAVFCMKKKNSAVTQPARDSLVDT